MWGVVCVLCFFKAIRQMGKSLTQCTDNVIHFERASCLGKWCTVSNKGSKNVQQIYERDSSAAEEHSHAWGGKDCHTGNGATTHNSIWMITAPTQAPGVPFHAFCISFTHFFFFFFTKLENAPQGTTLLAHLGFAPACCGWQSRASDTDSWQQCCTNQGTANFVGSYFLSQQEDASSSHAKVYGC